MIKLKEIRKSTLEQDIYEAKIEEALARWETEAPLESDNDNRNLPKKKEHDNEE